MKDKIQYLKHSSLCNFVIQVESLLCCNREQFPEDEERGSSDNGYENDETSLQQSMESDSVVDVTEDDSNGQYVEQDQSEEHKDKNNTNNRSDTGVYILVFLMLVYVFSRICCH